MNIRIFVIATALVTGFNCKVFPQMAQDVFFPTLYWGENVDRGVILIKPNEMVIVDSKGNKHEKVLAAEGVTGVYLSPNGKKMVYTTATSIWLVETETGQNYLVMKGDCYYLRWNADSLGFLFTVGEYRKEASAIASSFKFFWADGDGKNLKQIFP